MNETRRKPTTGRQSPSLFDDADGIFYMPSRIDEAGHTKPFDYPVAEHWGENRNVQFRGWDSNRQHIGPESNALPTEPPRFIQRIIIINPGSSTGGLLPTGGSSPNRGGGGLLPTGGIAICGYSRYKEQPRHEKANPMGPINLGYI